MMIRGKNWELKSSLFFENFEVFEMINLVNLLAFCHKVFKLPIAITYIYFLYVPPRPRLKSRRGGQRSKSFK